MKRGLTASVAKRKTKDLLIRSLPCALMLNLGGNVSLVYISETV